MPFQKLPGHDVACTKAIPLRAPITTTNSGGARHMVNKTKPTSATAKSPDDFTELVHRGF